MESSLLTWLTAAVQGGQSWFGIWSAVGLPTDLTLLQRSLTNKDSHFRNKIPILHRSRCHRDIFLGPGARGHLEPNLINLGKKKSFDAFIIKSMLGINTFLVDFMLMCLFLLFSSGPRVSHPFNTAVHVVLFPDDNQRQTFLMYTEVTSRSLNKQYTETSLLDSENRISKLDFSKLKFTSTKSR